MIRFAYVVRITYTFILFFMATLLMRVCQKFYIETTGSYLLCISFTICGIYFYYNFMEYNLNFILIRFSWNPKKWLSLFIRSIDFLIYSFLKFGKKGLYVFIILTVIPTGAVLIQKYTTYTITSPKNILANISFVILGFVMGYIDRKYLANNIIKDYLRIINLTDWLRFSLALGTTLIALGLATKYEILGEFVFGFCIGIAIDLYLLLGQRERTFAIRRGLLTYTYIKNAENMPETFIRNLLLGKSNELVKIMNHYLAESSKQLRIYSLMRCSFYFFKNKFLEFEDYYDSLPEEYKLDPWFRHLKAGTNFAYGDIIRGIEELTNILNSLRKKDKISDNSKLIPHIKTNLAAFYNFKYSYFGENKKDLAEAIKLCREATLADEECALSPVNLAYYLAKSVDSISEPDRNIILDEAEKFLNKALLNFSHSTRFPWFDTSGRRTSYSNIFFTDVRGFIYMKKEIYQAARNDFTECILKDPLYARGHFHLGQLFERISTKIRSDEDVVFQFLKVMTVLPWKPARYPIIRLAKDKLIHFLMENPDIKFWTQPHPKYNE